jgi:hypothetical protein
MLLVLCRKPLNSWLGDSALTKLRTMEAGLTADLQPATIQLL